VHSAEYQETLEKTCGPTFLPHDRGADVENTCSLTQIWQPDYIKTDLMEHKYRKAELPIAPAFVVAHRLEPSEITTMAAHIHQHLHKHTRKSRDMELHLPDRCTRWQPSSFLTVGSHASFED